MNRPEAIMRSGARLDLLAPQIERIRISDISEGLAKINRWVGATFGTYSVAQHSLIVAEDMYREDGSFAAVYGMVHDAHEALTGDIPTPAELALDVILPGASQAIEQLKLDVDRMIYARLDLDWPMPAPIHSGFLISHARVKATEARDLMLGCDDIVRAGVENHCPPLKKRIVPFRNWTRADEEWRTMLGRYAALAGLRLNLE